MIQTGKRPYVQKDQDNVDKSHKRRLVNTESSDQQDVVAYRVLCPDNVIGIVIGKGGKVINSIRHETNAKVKVVDPFPGAVKRVITIHSYFKDRDSIDVDDILENLTVPICHAQDALLRVHDAIVNGMAGNGGLDENSNVEANILVPISQSSGIIGKSGTIIKKLRAVTRANIKVIPKDTNDSTHSCAMSFDNFVQITGGTEAVRKALFAVSAIIAKYPPKEAIPLDTKVSDTQAGVIIPQDLPVYPASTFFPQDLSIVGSKSLVPDILGYADSVNALPVFPSSLPTASNIGGPSHSGELMIRILCPADIVGLVIGKSGTTIKNIRKASGAQIEVDDKKNEMNECLITVTCNESTDDMKSAAVEAVLLLQEKINAEEAERVNIRLLVPTKVIGVLIGKGGTIVNDMRKKTKADIRISKGEKPKMAANDELVEVFGEASSLRDALVQIVLRLREDVLKDKDDVKNSSTNQINTIDPLYLGGYPLHTVLPTIPSVVTEAERSVYYPSSLYAYGSSQVGSDAYGALSSYGSKAYGGTLGHSEMAIPVNALSKVMGKNGTNLDNIRKISGAQIEIVDSNSRFERLARISGTTDQKQSAENLIKAFIMST